MCAPPLKSFAFACYRTETARLDQSGHSARVSDLLSTYHFQGAASVVTMPSAGSLKPYRHASESKAFIWSHTTTGGITMAKRKSAKLKRIGRAKKRARPQKPHKTIGILHSGSKGRHDKNIAAFTDALGRTGYTDIAIFPQGEPLWSDDDPQKLAHNAQTLAANAELDLIIRHILSPTQTLNIFFVAREDVC
jgi:hypothetical protein